MTKMEDEQSGEAKSERECRSSPFSPLAVVGDVAVGWKLRCLSVNGALVVR